VLSAFSFVGLHGRWAGLQERLCFAGGMGARLGRDGPVTAAPFIRGSDQKRRRREKKLGEAPKKSSHDLRTHSDTISACSTNRNDARRRLDTCGPAARRKTRLRVDDKNPSKSPAAPAIRNSCCSRAAAFGPKPTRMSGNG